MDYNQLIRNWHLRASDNDYFSKFTFEYLAFIACLRMKKYQLSSNDRDALQKLKQDNDLKQRYFYKLSTEEKQSWQFLIDEFKNNARLGNSSSLSHSEEIKWWNHVCGANNYCNNSGCGSLPDGYTRFVDGMKGIIFSDVDWPNMVEFWRAVRDNLFHGSKDPEIRRDKLIVEHGFKTLHPLVELLLDENL